MSTKKDQAPALKAYQDFAKIYREIYFKKHNAKPVSSQISEAYKLRKAHGDLDTFFKEHQMKDPLKDEEKKAIKENQLKKKLTKLENKKIKEEKKSKLVDVKTDKMPIKPAEGLEGL